MHINKTEITQRQSEQTKIFKINYYIISKGLKNEMIKIIEVIGALYQASLWDVRRWVLAKLILWPASSIIPEWCFVTFESARESAILIYHFRFLIGFPFLQ